MNLKHILTILMLLLCSGTASAWWNYDWDYKRAVNINNIGGSALSDTQINVNVTYDAHMQNDFDDLRFINATDDVALSYWVEEKSDGSWCNVCVKSIHVNASGWDNGSVEVYYGNSAVSSGSDGDATFEMFDDFTDDSTIATDQITKDMVYDSSIYAMCPLMIELHDGTWFVVLFEGIQHGAGANHDLYWMNSTNDGVSWSTKSIITDYPDPVSAGNPSVLEFNDSGTWTILVSYNRLPGDGNVWAKCKKSIDGGQSWGAEINISDAVYRGIWGTSIEMSNGSLLVPLYKDGGTGGMGTWAAISSDSGNNWAEHVITTGTTADSEVSVIETSALDGHMVALIRSYGGTKTIIYNSTSSNYGVTWTSPAATTITTTVDGAPAALLRLDNGDLVASYELTNTDFRVAISEDDGVSWDTSGSRSIYYDATMPASSGYPSSVQINATHIYSIFYVSHAAGHADIYGNTVDISDSVDVWQKVGTPTLTYTAGILRINGTSNDDHRLRSTKSFSAPHVMESRSKIDWTGVNYAQLGFGLFAATAPGVEYANYQMESSGNNNSYPRNCNGTASVGTTGVPMNAYFVNEIKWKSDEVKFVYTGGTITHTTYIPSAAISVIIGGHGYSTGAFDMYLDWLFVRKYASPEPTSSLGAEEDAPSGNNDIVLGANKYGMLRKDVTAAQTFNTIASGFTHDLCFTWWDDVTDTWKSYWVGDSYNSAQSVPEHESYFVLMDGTGENVSCSVAGVENVNIPIGWSSTYLRESASKTLTAIKSDMGGNCAYLYAWDHTAGGTGAWTNTGSFSVLPNQGLLVSASSPFTWDGDVP